MLLSELDVAPPGDELPLPVLVPVVFALFEPLFDGLLNVVLLVSVVVPLPLASSDVVPLEPFELDEPLVVVEPLAVSASLAVKAPLDVCEAEACCCPPTDALCAKLSVVAVEAPKLELSLALWV